MPLPPRSLDDDAQEGQGEGVGFVCVCVGGRRVRARGMGGAEEAEPGFLNTGV